jgi:hypothetical protein
LEIRRIGIDYVRLSRDEGIAMTEQKEGERGRDREGKREGEREGQSARESEIGRCDGSDDIMPIMKSREEKREKQIEESRGTNKRGNKRKEKKRERGMEKRNMETVSAYAGQDTASDGRGTSLSRLATPHHTTPHHTASCIVMVSQTDYT